MMTISTSTVAVGTVVLVGAIVLAYRLGWGAGRRAERRRWERRISGQARKLGHARDAVRRALDKDAGKP
jgi:hypothetical protein